jgi:hypothetical protein
MQLVTQTGAKGLVLLIDEVESIYTKLPNANSRSGAYRVLSALCVGEELSDLRVALAITPDADRQMRADLPDLPDEGGLPCETIGALADSAASRAARIQCLLLTGHERKDLVRRIRLLMEAAYGPIGVAKSAWIEFVEEVAALEVPVRLLVRQAIDFLDAYRYGRGP